MQKVVLKFWEVCLYARDTLTADTHMDSMLYMSCLYTKQDFVPPVSC